MTLELVNCARSLGMDVDVASFYFSESLAKQLQLLGANIRDLVTDEDKLFGAAYDVVWLCHYPVVNFVAATLEVRASQWVRAVLSPFEPLEAVSGLERKFDLVLANSEETELSVRLELPEARVEVFPNSAPAKYFGVDPHRGGGLKRILLVSNHVPAMLREALGTLREMGVDIREIGKDGEVKLIEPEDIAEADAVISIGKTVQYALASGRPVFCYDKFGGPGWLTEDNFELAARLNFSGRGFDAIAPSDLPRQILEGYPRALNLSPTFKSVAESRYSLERNFDALLHQPSMGLNEARRIKSSMHAKQGRAYSALVGAHRHARNLCVGLASASEERGAVAEALQAEVLAVTAAADEERRLSQQMLADAAASAESLQNHLNKRIESLEAEILKVTAAADEERRLSQQMLADAAASAESLQHQLNMKDAELRESSKTAAQEQKLRAECDLALQDVSARHDAALKELKEARAQTDEIQRLLESERARGKEVELAFEREENLRARELEQMRAALAAARLLHQNELSDMKSELALRIAAHSVELSEIQMDLANVSEKYARAERVLVHIKRRLRYFPLLLSGVEGKEKREKGEE